MNDPFEFCRQHADFRALSALAVSLDLRYAGTKNICQRDLYQGCREAWLHREAFVRLEQAVAALARRQPRWSLRIFDAARPLQVQDQLFAKVRGTAQEAYVADPAWHSVHNYGFALDLGLQDEHGQELDLGTPFDSFDELAQPCLEDLHLRQGRLSSRHRDLRRVLRESLLAAGFTQNPLEWWHFEAKSLDELRGLYPLIP
jgi:D-alanyl-D-alanine dipeptidase